MSVCMPGILAQSSLLASCANVYHISLNIGLLDWYFEGVLVIDESLYSQVYNIFPSLDAIGSKYSLQTKLLCGLSPTALAGLPFELLPHFPRLRNLQTTPSITPPPT